jgi:hypothetical protein
MIEMRTLAAAVALAALLSPATLHADASGQDEAIAEQLFEEGLAFEKKAEWKAACDKYEASQRISPANGTLLKLGICHSQVGLTATGYGELIIARTRAKKDGRQDRVAIADEWLAKLEPHLSRLLLTFAPGGDLPGITLRIDGKEIDRGVLGTPFPVDPGDHRLEATAPGRTPWSSTFHIGVDADKQTITVPVLVSPPPKSATVTETDLETNSSASRRRTIGWIVGASGLAVAAVGGYFTLHALSLRTDAENMNASDPTGANSTNDDARRALLFGRIGIGVGIVAVGASAYLLLTSSSASRPSATASSPTISVTPWAGISTGGLVMQGAW